MELKSTLHIHHRLFRDVVVAIAFNSEFLWTKFLVSWSVEYFWCLCIKYMLPAKLYVRECWRHNNNNNNSNIVVVLLQRNDLYAVKWVGFAIEMAFGPLVYGIILGNLLNNMISFLLFSFFFCVCVYDVLVVSPKDTFHRRIHYRRLRID